MRVFCRFTIKESTIKGAVERYLLSPWKGKTCLRITRILKITVQVFHLKLFLGIDCFLSFVATDGKDGHGLKPNFFEVFISYLQKSPKTILWVVVPGEICFITSSQLHKSILCMAKGTNSCFKRCATAVPNSIDGIKFDLSTLPSHTAVERFGFKHCATAVPNSIHKCIINTEYYIYSGLH